VHLDHYTEGCLEPSEEDRNEAAAILARKEQWTIPTPGGEGPDCTKYHQVRTHDALDEFTNRLQADADYEYVDRNLKAVRKKRKRQHSSSREGPPIKHRRDLTILPWVCHRFSTAAHRIL